MYGLLALGMSLWNQLMLPMLFMCFWLVLFTLQIYTYFTTQDQPPSRERLLLLFLTRSDSKRQLRIRSQYPLLFLPNCLYNLVICQILPTCSSHIACDSYQPGSEQTSICFLLDTLSQPCIFSNCCSHGIIGQLNTLRRKVLSAPF